MSMSLDTITLTNFTIVKYRENISITNSYKGQNEQLKCIITWEGEASYKGQSIKKE